MPKTYLCPECGRELRRNEKCPECGKVAEGRDLLAEDMNRKPLVDGLFYNVSDERIGIVEG